MKRIVLLGPPGSGKGTQGKKLAHHLGLPFISMGDILREKAQEKGPLAEEVRKIMESGKYVPDEVVIQILQERLEQPDAKEGFILDGFPRTVGQADALDQILEKKGVKLDGIFFLQVREDIIVDRLSGRRVCPCCKMEYHIRYNPPKNDHLCDQCGSSLIQREDDQEGTIRKRISVYQ